MPTLPEDRPREFVARDGPHGTKWIEPGDEDYEWVLEDLSEHPEIGAFIKRIVPNPAYEVPASALLPQIWYWGWGRIELTWVNVTASFDFKRIKRTYRFDVDGSDIPWNYVRPDGTIMVHV